MSNKNHLLKYTLRLADNAMIAGHRLCEWSGKAPILEEDLALSNIALDFIGRAESLYKYAALIEGKGRTEDALAYKRNEREFYNHILCELSNGDFANTILRQYLFSTYELLFYTELIKSKDETLSAIASKSVKEIKYHLRHSHDWCIRLGDGTKESNQRIQLALNNLWMYTGELFEMDETDAILLSEGISLDSKALYALWINQVNETFKQAKIQSPENDYMQSGSRKGIHSEQLGYILAEMQFLQSAYPDAVW